MPINPLLLSKRWKHHTASGGYDQLAKNVDGTVINRRPFNPLVLRIINKTIRTVGPYSDLLDYRVTDLVAEIRTLRLAQRIKPDVVHVLYGDEQLDLLVRLRKFLPCPLVATFHLPVERVHKRFEVTQKRALANGLDCAIVVSTNQLDAFRNWLGHDKVVYVPHGIDTKSFVPLSQEDISKVRGDPLRLIWVGDHMRDFDLALRVLDLCDSEHVHVRLDAVLRPKAAPIFARYSNVHVHCEISESKLIALYRSADVAFIPVKNATANNSILEALSCGTPVISTNVGGVRDYMDDTCGWLFSPGDVDGVFECIRDISDHRDILEPKSIAARKRAQKFSWENVARMITSVYEKLQPAYV